MNLMMITMYVHENVCYLNDKMLPLMAVRIKIHFAISQLLDRSDR